ncbi:MAG: hypothetical protein AB7I79_08935 [Rhizobiaceae bacterium]
MAMTMNRDAAEARVLTPGSPLVWLGLAVLLVCLMMAVPLTVPVGPMYWDVIIYYDAAARIFDGQVPINDFFAPVGPLGYYIFAGWLAVFPDANPVLLAHWSLLAVTAPLMAAILWDVDGRSRLTAAAILIPFLIFALLPFNTRDFYPYPGSDGFGIYNRQCCQLLYVLTAALLLVRDRRILGAVVLVSMSALFFLKITGFVAGLILCAFAFLAGRIAFKVGMAAALAFFAVLAALEFSSELVSHYLADILALVEMNDGTILPRFMQAASLTFGIIAPAGMLALLILWFDRRKLAAAGRAVVSERSPAALARFLDHNAIWLLVAIFAGILFETQNTGSQAMIFLWPIVLAIVLRSIAMMAKPALMGTALVLAAASMLPIAVNTVERAARTFVGGIKNEPMPNENLKSIGALSSRPEVLERAHNMLAFYGAHLTEYEDLVAVGELPTPVLYSDFDFQLGHLMAIDHAISSIRRLEAERGVRFETIMSLNFVNPFPWLMDRRAPKHIAIGADPSRAVPRPGPFVTEAVEDTDLVLYPLCPLTTANAHLYQIYGPMLDEHRRIHLDECFDAFVHPRFADRFK